MENTTATENTPYTLPECTFTAPEGMRFSTWSIGTPDGERKAVGEAIILTETISLYAIWETIPHDHSFGTDFETDADEHWNECECGDKSNVGAHADADADGKCDVCAYQMSTPAPDNSGEGTQNDNNTPTETEAPATDSSADTTEEKKGCGSTVSLSALAIVGIMGMALAFKKKED